MLKPSKFLVIVPIVLLLIITIAGCTTNESSNVASIEINSFYTEPINTDADADIDAIRVRIQPKDEAGNDIVALGHLTIQIFEQKAGDTIGATDIAYLSTDISKKDYNYGSLKNVVVPFRDNYRVGSEYDQFIFINASFTTPNGATYYDTSKEIAST